MVLSYNEQIQQHIAFLRGLGLEVEELKVDGGFVRCRGANQEEGRGNYAYKTSSNEMNKKGLVGLVTWCRGLEGTETSFKTYGSSAKDDDVLAIQKTLTKKKSLKDRDIEPKDVARKACAIWRKAELNGSSKYLWRKGVNGYGIRYLRRDYGDIALVPLRDWSGEIKTLQFLLPDGMKRFLKGPVSSGLFFLIGRLGDGEDVGLSEGFVTGATCFELCGFPVIVAFTSSNLVAVAREVRSRYPKSRLVIFGDDDRHVEKNKGRKAAMEAAAIAGPNSLLAFPDFVDLPASKDVSDWNDLVRLRGKEVAKAQIKKMIGDIDRES